MIVANHRPFDSTGTAPALDCYTIRLPQSLVYVFD